MKKNQLFTVAILFLVTVGSVYGIADRAGVPEPGALAELSSPGVQPVLSAAPVCEAASSRSLPAAAPWSVESGITICALDQECAYRCELFCGGVTNPCFTACLFPNCCIN